MQTKDVTKILKKFNWVPYCDNIGNYHACYYLSDRIVRISYEVKYGWRDRKLMLVASLTTAPYLLAWNMSEVRNFLLKIRSF
ncbi:DUF6990 domain-containing protein [Bartonella saheliensis]|uniref:DUF6990 domain-containing protein n=1 Tax=Bartonella saheliensis TaxID=1457016 RepID=UPI003CCC4E79